MKSGLDPPAGSRHLFCRTEDIDLLATERLAAAAQRVPAFNCQPSTGREVEVAAVLLQPLFSRGSCAAVQQVRYIGLGQPTHKYGYSQ